MAPAQLNQCHFCSKKHTASTSQTGKMQYQPVCADANQSNGELIISPTVHQCSTLCLRTRMDNASGGKRYGGNVMLFAVSADVFADYLHAIDNGASP
jgi:hypothetical protein